MCKEMELRDLIPKENRAPGLSESELGRAQEAACAEFPPDLCELLTATLPSGSTSSGSTFPDWRTRPREAMDDWRARLVHGLHFDVLNNDFWPNAWGARPDNSGESLEIVTQRLNEAPALIPIYAHRAIPNEPLEAGNPVFSVWQTDIIVYGNDLPEYLRQEFHGDEFNTELPKRTIRFWTAMLDADEL
jgi:hypothetical protein